MAALITSVSLITGPCLDSSCSLRAPKSKGASSAPGRPSTGFSPLRILVRSGSGKPPVGIPMSPRINSTTEVGKLSSSALRSTSSADRSFCTMKAARSPTTFDEGVTLMMSPSSLFASA